MTTKNATDVNFSPWETSSWRVAPSKINIYTTFNRLACRESRPGDCFGSVRVGVSGALRDQGSRTLRFFTAGLLLFCGAISIHLLSLVC